MMNPAAAKYACVSLLLVACLAVGSEDPVEPKADEPLVLESVEVTAQRVANLQPAGTYATTVSELRFDPQFDIQVRGLPEGQADVTIRGGLFRNTGFRIGAVPVFDPQTGHYAVELPIDPGMLSAPRVLTDGDNAVNAFNTSLATLHYDFSDIVTGGEARAGIGADKLRFVSTRVSRSGASGRNRAVGMSLAAAASSGDGSLPFGDHDFRRFSGHLQLQEDNHESNLVLGYLDKFYGWPGAYTGFASLPETDHVKLGFAIADHRRDDARGWWRLSAAYRWLDDDYDFDRRTVDTGGAGSFEHQTRSLAVGVDGARPAAGADWTYSLTVVADRLARSTDLTHGKFNSRTYLGLSLAPAWQWTLASGDGVRLRAGLRGDVSNRDGNALMPIADVSWERPLPRGSQTVSLGFTKTSQLPGYTALNSSPTGLFGGNPDLGREFANTLALGYTVESGAWRAQATLFARRDDDLVDWTFRRGAPFARQANPVDMDVSGFECSLGWDSDQWRVLAGYSFLDKDADYGQARVDASYYALNFARHRATLAVRYRPTPRFELRLDNEYRLQQRNPLRTSDRRAWLASFSASWQLPKLDGARLDLVVDNLADSDFQEFPGTPAYGRQLSLQLGLAW